jgi:hypothetical protein
MSASTEDRGAKLRSASTDRAVAIVEVEPE